MKYFIIAVALLGVSCKAQECDITCQAKCPIDTRCPAQNLAQATLLPHLNDCSKFVKCETGHGCPHNCPQGLHFNNVEKACDWPWNACCDPSIPCGTTPSDPSNCSPNTRCPAVNPAQPVLLPHQQCSRFYKCHNGQACEYECPPGLHFNDEELACDWPWRACCDPSVPCNPCPTCPPAPGATTTTPLPPVTPAPPPPVTPAPPPPVTPAPPPPVTPAPPPPVTPAPPPPVTPTVPPTGPDCPTCPSNCSPDARCPAVNPAKPVLLPDSTNCSEFFKCESGRACRLICPNGLHFNERTDVCDWPWNACCDKSVTCLNPCVPGVTCPPTLG